MNDTDRTNLYNVDVYKIDRPGRSGEKRVESKDKEVLFSPVKFLLKEKGLDYFKLHYFGPRDAVERYYRVVFSETPVQLFPFNDMQKNMHIIPVVSVSSILIVRPRKIDFNYAFDMQYNRIKNTGNTYFRVIIHKGCNGDDESSTQFYMLPGEVFQDKIINEDNKKFIVGPDGYINLGKGCFGS